MLAASLTEKALGSRVDVTSDNPVTKLGPSSVSSNSASDYRITIDSARKALKKGSVAFDGGVEIDKMRFLPIRFGLQLGGRDKIAYSTGIGYNTQLLQFDMAIKLNRGFSVNSLKGAEFSFGLLFRPIY